MAHEQSETSQGTPWATPPPGRWVNTYGPGTLYSGQQLPGTPTYPDAATANAAAGLRSIFQGVGPALLQDTLIRRSVPPGAGQEVQPKNPPRYQKTPGPGNRPVRKAEGETGAARPLFSQDTERRQSSLFRQATGTPIMRFDAYGREGQVPEKGASQYDVDEAMKAAGMTGMLVYAKQPFITAANKEFADRAVRYRAQLEGQGAPESTISGFLKHIKDFESYPSRTSAEFQEAQRAGGPPRRIDLSSGAAKPVFYSEGANRSSHGPAGIKIITDNYKFGVDTPGGYVPVGDIRRHMQESQPINSGTPGSPTYGMYRPSWRSDVEPHVVLERGDYPIFQQAFKDWLTSQGGERAKQVPELWNLFKTPSIIR